MQRVLNGVDGKRGSEDETSEPGQWNNDRPYLVETTGWNRLMDDVRAGKVSKVVCWRLDRLGCTARGLTALFDELLERKINLVSLRDGNDLATPAGRLMAHVLASVAQYETEVRAERIKAGQAVARAKGKTWGGSEKGRRLKVTDEQLKVIRSMSKDGETIVAIFTPCCEHGVFLLEVSCLGRRANTPRKRRH